ncbi:helix-turn-helix domain-containing protein [Megasphaera elsdenii]|uniref:helix-turn-helix domain-containing protein n=1 Tax=Megasphaera elsdenii TaxID=907 RepID=UPI001D00C35A|nr:helix-turn-helix transcriptional regulator [Megasphaera elsdenii]MCB5701484.1 helix-turn-helix domain-containing protein [Megasphaera elsdenii]MCB5726244.1 helix-turn-helix domain-containing protein [Megasphaera elsdenii]MCB5770033.1 helix-turn-helix domain-containing protein [Megasphaera elsdenii]
MFDEPLFRYMMNRRQLSMAVVADRLGVNETTLYRKIKGKSDFSRAEIQALKAILGMTTDECVKVFFAD